MSFTPLGYSDLGLAAILIAVNAVLFIWLRLKLERQLVIATLRMLVQLSLLGLVLKTLFEHVSPIYTGLAALAMILFAGYGAGVGLIGMASVALALIAASTASVGY